MSKFTPYSEKLKDPQWQKKRLEIFERDKWSCTICGSKSDELQVHHKKYSGLDNPWESNNDDLTTLCSSCHSKSSRLVKRMRWMCSYPEPFGIYGQVDELLTKEDEKSVMSFFDVFRYIQKYGIQRVNDACRKLDGGNNE